MNFQPHGQLSTINQIFPQYHSLSSNNSDNNNILLKRHILHSPNNNETNCLKFVNVMQRTISNHYVKVKGTSWMIDKLQEMQEDGLIYIYYTIDDKDDNNKDEIIGFISFVLTWDGELVLYLYEIHVLPDYNGQGLGKFLIEKFHQLAMFYKDNNELLNQVNLNQLFGTKLTVFSDNKVLSWYKKLGYTFSDESPRDKKLRGGRVVKPDYYILVRSV